MAASGFRVRGSHPLCRTFPDPSANHSQYRIWVLQPQSTEVDWFGLFPVRSPLLGESQLISFPEGT